MRITCDKKTNTLYIMFRKGRVYETIEKTRDVLIDLDKDGKMIGIEFLGVKNTTAQKKIYKDLTRWTKRFIERYRKDLEALAHK